MTRSTPVYAAIATALRTDIGAGRYPMNARLPSEGDLARRFGVNRHTVRHALAKLAEDGLVYSRRGSGTYVCGHLTEYRIGRRVRFHQNLTDAGHRPTKRVLDIETRHATTQEADRLDLTDQAPVCVVHGLSLADEQPIAFYQSCFPATRLPGIALALRACSSITDALGVAGVSDYTRAQTQVSAALADATQALHLKIREGAPLIETISLNVDPTGVPVEHGHTWFAADRVSLLLEAE